MLRGEPALVHLISQRNGEKASYYSAVRLETGEAVREWLSGPGLNLRLVNLPGYSPDFNADEAVWGWIREEATGNICLGTMASVQESERFSRRPVQQEGRGQASLRDRPAIKSRGVPAKLPSRAPAPPKCTSHIGFSLV